MHSVGIAEQAWPPVGAALVFAISPRGSYSSIASAAHIKVTLGGDQEVPPAMSAGTGTGTIVIGTDRSVSGRVTITGIAGTAADIHERQLAERS